MTARQLRIKFRSHGTGQVIAISRREKLILAWRFLIRLLKNNYFSVEVCARTVSRLHQTGIRRISLYGEGDTAALVEALARHKLLEIDGIFHHAAALDDRCRQSREQAEQWLNNEDEKIIIASFADAVEKYHELRARGIDDRSIVVLE